MKLNGNTILITGGTSGIGFELASRFVELGNQVIVTGRSASNLEAARRKLPGLHTIQSDVADPRQIAELYRQIAEAFPRLNLLINNAGIMRKLDLQAADTDLEDLTREIDINLNGTIRMAVQFLPLLKRQPEAAIVNVSSGLAFRSRRSTAPPRPPCIRSRNRCASSCATPASRSSNWPRPAPTRRCSPATSAARTPVA